MYTWETKTKITNGEKIIENLYQEEVSGIRTGNEKNNVNVINVFKYTIKSDNWKP